MDIFTHGLASIALARGFFPRTKKAGLAFAVVAGTIADVDRLSSYFGPSSFLAWHGTYLHSILAAILIAVALPAILVAAILRGGLGFELEVQPAVVLVDDPRLMRNRALRKLVLELFFVCLLAALLHIAMDACQSGGVMLLWPFDSRRFAADWLPGIDPWILTILIGAVAIPELLRLVGSEIGAKSKKPHGQTGAIIGLVLLFVYVGARATLHSDVLAMMSSRNIHGETAHRVWAYPEPLSLFTWYGVVETESSLDEMDVNATDARDFDPDSSVRNFKPEASPALSAARNTEVAKRFLAAAQIPKASVEKTEAGYVVVLRDLRYAAAGERKHEVAAYFEFDRANRLTTQELVWARELRK
ncbi:MAG: metal-dependent hydrolase [Candidatus Acidiferrum sp.]